MNSADTLVQASSRQRTASLRVRFWPYVFATCAVALGLVFLMHILNPRLIASWHGFLHSAIARRFPTSQLPPENPFYAGQPLPYYWFYHALAAGLSRVTHVDLLHTFHALTLTALVVFISFSMLNGRDRLGTAGAGVLVAYLALVGVNPAGPLIALGKHWVMGTPLFEAVRSPVETVFVSDKMADGWMTHPLLGALYIMADWRSGQNISWFLDISARGPALACLLGLIYFSLQPVRTRRGLAFIALFAALTAAFNPVIGIGSVGCLAIAKAIDALLEDGLSTSAARKVIAPVGAALFGLLIASATFWHLFFYGNGTTSLATRAELPGAALLVLSTHAPLFVLAWLGLRRAPETTRRSLRICLLAGAILASAVALVRLEDGNEHNFGNAAACFLALPAAAWASGVSAERTLIRMRRWLVYLFFLPGAVATLSAYVRRPPLPLAFEHGEFRRLPAGSPLDQLYTWIRASTPRTAIFVTDPKEPVKMSGNVSELPAFTARTLFTDQANYLTAPLPDAVQRLDLSARIVLGEELSAADRAYIARFARPVYAIIYHANRRELRTKLEHAYGAPVFLADWVAVFDLRALRRD